MRQIDQAAADLIARIGAARIDLSDEKRAQAQIGDVLTSAGIAFEREVRLSPGDVVDFMVGDIALEVKLKRNRKQAVFRQLLRYVKHDRVKGIILATNLGMGLPRAIDGVPAWYISLGRAWL